MAHMKVNINDAKNFYEALTGVYGPNRLSLHPVRSTDGVLIKNNEFILARLAECPQNLLNKVHTTDPGFLDNLLTLPIIPKRDDPSSFDEVVKAILSLKDSLSVFLIDANVERWWTHSVLTLCRAALAQGAFLAIPPYTTSFDVAFLQLGYRPCSNLLVLTAATESDQME